ncbi:phosphoribosylamine--glycine ligase [Spirochaetia bacterium]|nr:phosphoribosylamine--glycine ligase [Spirochaetia bacterium]
MVLEKEKLNIAVIGSGGREHAIITKLLQSKRTSRLIAIPGNGGIARDVPCVDINAGDITGVVNYCKNNGIDYVVVAPDDPLALGMVDALDEAGIPSFGPVKKAARIEASKIFAKDLMKKHNIPTAGYETFDDSAAALRYVQEYFTGGRDSIVIKADGLALGKGVTVCLSLAEAQAAVYEAMDEKRFGASGEHIVIEEFLQGPEVSVLAFCDGSTVVPMITSMDHKRAHDGDNGPNTGGMGTIAPSPFWTPHIASACMEKIFLPTVEAMKKTGAPFKGCLYFGLMLTRDGPKVIEYNCRFGDPETQVVLPLLNSDLLEIMLACTNGTLKPEMVQFTNECAACIIMASGGYPSSYNNGYKITGIEEVNALHNVKVYVAGAAEKDGALVTSGGRVLGVTAAAPDLQQALNNAYNAVKKINFENCYYRKDIGKKALQSN